MGFEGVYRIADCNDGSRRVAVSRSQPEILVAPVVHGYSEIRLVRGAWFPVTASRFLFPVPRSRFPFDMPARVDNLREPSDRAVRLVALGHLADAASAHERLVNQADDEALHDFRVALRRLRTWERAFRPFLRRDISRKLRRRLRKLARDTGASRDLEVHLDWLATQRRSLGRRQRAGVQWIVEKLEERKAEADAVLEEATDGRFDRIESRFSRALGSYSERIQLRRDGRAVPPPPFANALAPRVRNAATELEQHLSHVRTPGDEEEGHEARIAAKRLRYLLEPIVKVVPGAIEVVERLKTLQDVLGDLHDAQVFGAEITGIAVDAALGSEPNAVRAPAPRSVVPARPAPPPVDSSPVDAATQPEPAGTAVAEPPATPNEAPEIPATPAEPAATASATPEPTPVVVGGDLGPGIDAINERLRARSGSAFAQFTAEWLGDRSAPFFRDIDAVIERIAEAAGDGLEIERKYLLSYVPEVARDSRWIDIAQGYIPGGRLHERIRRVSVRHGSGRKETHYYRTVKLGEGVTRVEIEEETTEAIFLAMWPLTRRRRLRKRRFEVDVDGRTWQIDQFRNRDLVLAEIELDSEDEDVTFPEWLAPAVQREVTGEPEFQNINLAR